VTTPTTDISTKLLASRQELLDIGLRNTLINFRAPKKSLALVDLDPGAVFDALYMQQNALSFAALGRSKTAAGGGELLGAADRDLLAALGTGLELPSDDAEVPGGGSRRGKQVRLYSALGPEALQLHLLKIRTEAQTYIEEKGVNVLYLALGFLHWFEADSAQEARKAPLALVPVTLERSNARERFTLRYTGDELNTNQSLAAKLKSDFDLHLPEIDTSGDFDVDALEAYFAEVATAVQRHPRWRVLPSEGVLGFFSFGKYLMYKDLDPKVWPAGQEPTNHPVVTRLLLHRGFSDMPPAYPEDVQVDTVVTPGEVHFVKDADSSQTQAILEVRSGANLVIQGPPGTGKSQTITNLIAELVGRNKTVLFVSEKMAALEVVKRRLDEAHLGDAVLELHSQQATKASVLKELGRALEQGRPLNDAGDQEIQSLSRLQAQLNGYCDAISAPVGQSGLPFVEVLGRHLATQRKWPELVALSFEPMKNWHQRTFQDHLERVEALTVQVEAMGTPKSNAFWGAQRTFVTPVEEAEVRGALDQALTNLQTLTHVAESLSTRLSLGHPATLSDIEVIVRAARRAAEAPKLDGVQLRTQDWQIRREALRELLQAGKAMAKVRAKLGPKLIEAAWEQDFLQTRQALLAHGSKWWKFLLGDWRRARNHVQSVASAPLSGTAAEMLALVDGVLSYRQHQRAYDKHAPLGEALYGAQWQGPSSDWAVLSRITEWVIGLYEDVGKGNIPEGIVAFLAGHRDAAGLGEVASDVEARTKAVGQALARVATGLELSFAALGIDTTKMPLPDLMGTLQNWRDRISDLSAMARFNHLAQPLKDAGLTELLSHASATTYGQELPALLELTWLSGLVTEAYRTTPALQQFDRLQHEEAIKRFRRLDLSSLNHAQTKLARQLWERRPSLNQPGEMATLRAELNKKRRHLPIRQLLAQAGRAIQQLKPVFMMSPISIANFLPPGCLSFDVVIFDEASQVKAVDAFGAILRGKQTVVVGDTRQMPPTEFFGREVEVDDEDNATSDIESILSLFKAAGCHERYLRWHYRSRHESLIAVSNAEFYDNKLVIFPTAGANPDARGVTLEHLPHAVYDRGNTRTNKEEAKAVAQAVLSHARNTPHLTLGVAAFSVAQRDLIEVEVEMLRRVHPEAETFFSRHPHEPFFVKNLENIQGDERDVMFISVGYGRNEAGKIAKNFGPLLREGGERRLNVLITRAKLSMRVFCNFTADDLELDAKDKHGVRALKSFLRYAQTRRLEVARETGNAADSPFETEVLLALRERGYEIEPQVGTAGYFIDLAVKDPERPGRYLLAVECDGAAYHSAKSARDRDRLRQGVLEGLGWRFHRIWSSDWFRNRAAELERVVEAIEAARLLPVDASPAPVVPTTPTPHVIERDAVPAEPEPVGGPPYTKTILRRELHLTLTEAPSYMVAGLVQTVVETEAPVHLADVTRRITEAFGVARAGSRIQAKIQEAVNICVYQKRVKQRGEFLYRAGEAGLTVRDRSALPQSEKNIELVAPEELDQALLEAVALGFTLTESNAISAALTKLGFGRATQKAAGVVGQRLGALVAGGSLEFRDGRYNIPGK
jgi:very-short-patch-repair endonuclease/DNA polymerase III delta prime subunit